MHGMEGGIRNSLSKQLSAFNYVTADVEFGIPVKHLSAFNYTHPYLRELLSLSRHPRGWNLSGRPALNIQDPTSVITTLLAVLGRTG